MKPRELDGSETVIRDPEGDEVVIYRKGNRVGLGTMRAGKKGGFAVLLDGKGVDAVIAALKKMSGERPS